ncbi:MAG: shikimate dehydrogenase [Nocardioidaceae bacterium]
MVRRCAVLGKPIAHSLSPVMHRAAYQHLGMDWTYDAIEVDEAGLARFLTGLDEGWRGLSLTMPLKRVALPLLDEVSDTAREVRAVNTIVLEDGERRGHNTDIPGMVAALAEHGVTGVSGAAVLGTGATAASSIAALIRMGVAEVVILGRDPDEAAALAGWAGSLGVRAEATSLDTSPAREVELLVSTVPAAALSAMAHTLVQAAAVVFDVGYSPWPSPLLETALSAGRRIVTGVDLLAHQAVLQVALMTGDTVPVDVLRRAAVAQLGSPE